MRWIITTLASEKLKVRSEKQRDIGFSFFALFFSLIIILLPTLVWAGDMKVSMNKKWGGKSVLAVSIDGARNGQWLGVTIYPPSGNNPQNRIFPLKEGSTSAEVELPSAIMGGTYEVAVWDRKISKEQCLPTDTICQQMGYRFEGLDTYMWGRIRQ